MAGRPAQFGASVQGAHQFRDLVRGLRAAGRGDLKREMNAKIRAAAKPVVDEVKRAARALPDRSPATRRGGGSMRADIAKAVQLSIRQDGVRIVVNSKRMPVGARQMAFAFEAAQFRHPVFGRSDRTRTEWKWVQQRTGGPWFRPVMRRNEHVFRAAINDVMADTMRRLG